MTWNIDARNLPHIRCYADALTFYNCASPSPARDDWRALGRKQDTSKIVKKEFNGDIRLRYHHTDVVTYTEAGGIEVITYNSSNTVAFADALLPNGLRAISHRGDMYICVDGGAYTPVRNGRLEFFQDPIGVWHVHKTTAAPVIHYELNRSKAAAIRKTIKPFFDWMASAKRVGAQFPTHQWGRRTPYWLKEFLPTGHIPEERYAELATCTPEYRDLYVLGGAVTKVLAPCGALPKDNQYEVSPMWAKI